MATERRKANRLRKLRITRVDTVDRGAAPDAHIVIAKRFDDELEKNFPPGAKAPPFGSKKKSDGDDDDKKGSAKKLPPWLKNKIAVESARAIAKGIATSSQRRYARDSQGQFAATGTSNTSREDAAFGRASDRAYRMAHGMKVGRGARKKGKAIGEDWRSAKGRVVRHGTYRGGKPKKSSLSAVLSGIGVFKRQYARDANGRFASGSGGGLPKRNPADIKSNRIAAPRPPAGKDNPGTRIPAIMSNMAPKGGAGRHIIARRAAERSIADGKARAKFPMNRRARRTSPEQRAIMDAHNAALDLKVKAHNRALAEARRKGTKPPKWDGPGVGSF